MKLYYSQKKNDEFIRSYKRSLTYIQKAVTKNYSEKSINKILDYVSSSENSELLRNVYDLTLKAMKDSWNEVHF